MKGARKGCAPKEFTDWVALENDDWKPSYPIDDPAVRKAVVDALYYEQRGLCVYCGRKIELENPGHSFHVEHFRPQHRYPELQISFENLFLSCGHTDRSGDRSKICGTKKDRWFDEAEHVAPNYDCCTKRFSFRYDGSIRTAHPGDLAAQNMIDHLGLNHAELKYDRAKIIEKLDTEELDASDFSNPSTGISESYGHVACQYLGTRLP
ncbi:retron system putative HNH endonuclease [Cognatishimia sp.]|uniref:retron system putative HNH endonuclease n=1 Tax=Cognatishimia sp. TaxID=2211648 RepID=UPI0035139522|nr:TIGR02646 family protein [Cognatishimia sp.]